MTLGTRLRKNREKRRLSQKEVAEQVGVSQTTYHNWEADVSGFRVDFLLKLAEVLDVEVTELIPGVNAAKPISKPSDYAVTKTDFKDEGSDIDRLYKNLLSSKEEIIQLLRQENDTLKARNAQLEEAQKATGHTKYTDQSTLTSN